MPLARRELITGACVSAAAACLFVGYSAIRNAASTLFKATYGPERLPLLMAVMPLGVLAVVYLYARILSRLGPRRTLLVTTLGSGAVIAALYVAIRAGSRAATAVLPVFSDAYISLLIEQYWSLINSTLTKDSAKKLNGPITGLASLGAIAGGLLVGQLARPWGTTNMLLLAAASVLPAAFISDVAYRRAGEPAREPTQPIHPQPRTLLALGLFTRQPILSLILLMVIATQVISAAVTLNYQTVLQRAIPDADAQTAWAGNLEALLNGVAAVMQFLVAPLLLRLMPVGWALVLIATAQVGASTLALGQSSLPLVAAAYVCFKAADYSVFRAAKETLYVPLSFDARYRAKELIDVLGYRFAKGATSAGLALLDLAGVAIARLYGPVALGASLVWVLLALPVRRFSRTTENSSPAPSDPAPAAR